MAELSLERLLNFWQGGTGINLAQISAAAQMQGMRQMERAHRRAEAQVDCHITGEYNPPEAEDMGGIYFNPLIIGDRAIETLPQECPPTDPPQPPQRPPPAPARPINWPLILSILAAGGLVAWSVYYFADVYEPPSSSPRLDLEFIQEPP